MNRCKATLDSFFASLRLCASHSLYPVKKVLAQRRKSAMFFRGKKFQFFWQNGYFGKLMKNRFHPVSLLPLRLCAFARAILQQIRFFSRKGAKAQSFSESRNPDPAILEIVVAIPSDWEVDGTIQATMVDQICDRAAFIHSQFLSLISPHL